MVVGLILKFKSIKFSPFQHYSTGVQRRAEKSIHKSAGTPKNRGASKIGEETGLQFHVCVCVCVCVHVFV